MADATAPSPPQPEEVEEKQVGVDVQSFIDEAIAQGKGWTDEERRSYLASIDDSKHPFFAQSIEDMDPDMVEAFRAVAYENETPESLAQNMKDVGNDRFKRTRVNRMYFKTAAEAYTEGIKHAVMAEQTEEMVILRATLLANRAAASLGRKNFGGCIRDCDASLALVPGNIKCYFRKAKAQTGLRRYAEAIKSIEAGAHLSQGDTPDEFTTLQEQCMNGLAEDAEREQSKKERRERQCELIREVYRRCASRKIRIGPSMFEEGHYRWQSQYMPTPLSKSSLSWPVLLLYPQHGQSDFIQAASEDDLIAVHMAQVFPEEGPPAPWDRSFEYRCSNLSVYVKLHAARPFENQDACVQEFLRVKAMRGEEVDASALPDQRAVDDDDDDEALQLKRKIAQWRLEEGQRWASVHPACSILQLLQASGHVVASGTIVIFLVPSEGPANDEFRRRTASQGGIVTEIIPPGAT